MRYVGKNFNKNLYTKIIFMVAIINANLLFKITLCF